MDKSRIEIAAITRDNAGFYAPYLPASAREGCLKRDFQGFGSMYRDIAAGAAMMRFSQRAELTALLVEGKLRRRGLGSLLLSRCVTACAERGIKTMSVRFESRPFSCFTAFLLKNGFHIMREGGAICQTQAGELLQAEFFSGMQDTAIRPLTRLDRLKSDLDYQLRRLSPKVFPPLAGTVMKKYSFAFCEPKAISAYALLCDTRDGAVVNQIYCAPGCGPDRLRAVLYAVVKTAAIGLGEDSVLSFPVFNEDQDRLVRLITRDLLPERREILQAEKSIG